MLPVKYNDDRLSWKHHAQGTTTDILVDISTIGFNTGTYTVILSMTGHTELHSVDVD